MRELPEGWTKAEIGSLCSLENGRAFKPTDWTTTGFPIVRIQNLNNPNASFNYFNQQVDERYFLRGGELLFAWSGTPGTSFGAHVWKGGEAVLNQHIFRVDLNYDLVEKRFFRFAINQKLNELIGIAHGGVGLRHVTKGKFESTEVVLPPINEQKRIADRLDQLLTRIDKTKAHLDRIPPLLKRFRQSVLAIATSGKLTADWREESLSLGNGEQLLQSIREDRYEMWKHDLIQKGKDWKKIKYKMIQHADIDKIYSIPKSWAWTSLGELTWSVKDGPHYTPQYSESGIPFISGGNITPDGIDFENTRFISPELHQELSERCCPQLGDILYTKGGTTGIARVNTYEIDFNVWVHVSVLKCLGSIESFGVA